MGLNGWHVKPNPSDSAQVFDFENMDTSSNTLMMLKQ